MEQRALNPRVQGGGLHKKFRLLGQKASGSPLIMSDPKGLLIGSRVSSPHLTHAIIITDAPAAQ